MAKVDLVIRGGRVLDGSGGPERSADIAICDGQIESVGRFSGQARQTLDADGALVTPGFVDIHTHYDGQATWGERMAPSSHHGVTTVVMGNCGVGFAPVRSSDHQRLIELMEGVEDIPGAALHEGLSWDWESFPDYLDVLAQRRFDMDLGAQLPHGALRVFVMGERGAAREPATAQDIAQMRTLTEQAIRAGALGVTSSRTLNHRSSTGEPTPSLTAEFDELLGIAMGLKDAGRGVFEMISDFHDLDAEFSMLEAVVAQSGRPMSVSLAEGLSPNGWRDVLGRIDQAVANGHVMRGQVAPRAIGVLMGLTTTLNPFMGRPSFAQVADLPLSERVQALSDPQRKARILEEPAPNGFRRMMKLMSEGAKLWELRDPPDYEPAVADSMAGQAQRLGIDAWSLIYDRMLANGGETILYVPFANYANNNLDCCREMILAENTVMGLGDGGAHVGTICDASFITTLFTHWGRDRSRGALIDLPTLVKSQTLDTARAVDLQDRGLLAPGMKADVNVIDFDALQVGAPKIVHDLPAGGPRLEQRAQGYLATVVSGAVTYQNGQPTGALPGRLIRKV